MQEGRHPLDEMVARHKEVQRVCNAFLEVLRMDDGGSLQRHGAWAEKTSVQQVILMADGATFPVVASVQQWLLSCASTPVTVHAAGQLPAFVGPDTAVLGVSYSSQLGGSDTIAQLCAAARQKGAQVHHIIMHKDGGSYDATDSQLAMSLHKAVPWQMQTIRLWWWVAAALQQLGVITGDLVQEINAARQAAAAFTETLLPHVPLQENLAKQIAVHSYGKAGVFYVAPELASLAAIWQQAWQVTAKTVASAEYYPVAYSAAPGWTGQPIMKPFAVIDIASEHTGQSAAMKQLAKKLSGQRPQPMLVFVPGKTVATRLVQGTVLAHLAASYAAVLHGKPLAADEVMRRLLA